MRDRGDGRSKWFRATLAAGAGLGSLVVCSGAMVAIFLLIVSTLDFGAAEPLSSRPVLFWVGVLTATIFGGASLALPALALGAREERALKANVLSGLCFCAFVLFCFLSLTTVSIVPRFVALAALIAAPPLGALIAVHEEGQVALGLLWAAAITASVIFCASLLAFWLVPKYDWPSTLAPVVVAASSWPVLPALVAVLRSD